LFQAVPQGGDADGNLQLLETPLLEFAQGQIRLLCNPLAQGAVMLFQAGAAITTNLFGPACTREPLLLPKTLHTFAADTKTLANLPRAVPALPRGDDPLTQILTQRPHNSLFMERDYNSQFRIRLSK
jgi:hypothetical protein